MGQRYAEASNHAGEPPKLAVFGLPEDGRAERAEELRRLGFDALIAGVDRAVAEAGTRAGLSVFACDATFTADPAADEALLAVDVDGQRRSWFGSGCPNQPELRARHQERLRAALAWPEISGFFLDGIRFASPAAGLESFLTCFCEACARKARHLGFDIERIRTDVKKFRKSYLQDLEGMERLAAPMSLVGVTAELPGVSDWLAFRAACIEEYTAEVAAFVNRLPGEKRLGAYLFTPALAPLVGQDYRRLRPLLWAVSPMIYRLGAGDSVLGTEMASIASWPPAPTEGERARAVRAVLRLCGLGAVSRATTLAGLQRPLSPRMVAQEARSAARELGGGDRLVPIVWLDDSRVERVVGGVLASGATGVSFFAYRAGSETFLRRAVTAAMAAQRRG